MYIKRLSITNFRNYGQSSVDLTKGFVCITGDNGTGKTNLLDAIHYLGFCRSFRTRTEALNLRETASFFRLVATFCQQEQDLEVVAKFAPGSRGAARTKEISCNGEIIEKLSQHIGRFPMVLLSPDDHLLMDGYSEERRKFIDATISQLDSNYLEQLMRYNQALKQRNSHLKEDRHNHQLLDGLDMALSSAGSLIFERRKAFLEDFLPVFDQQYNAMAEGKEQVGASYTSQLQEKDFEIGLSEARQRDCLMSRSTFGIHKDEIAFEINGFQARQLGSQGQKKTFLLALKIAQMEYLREATGIAPILMLDDLFDKLDRGRVNALFQLLGRLECQQVLITDTNFDRVQDVFSSLDIEYQPVKVDAGALVE